MSMLIDCIICGERDCAYQTYEITDVEWLKYITLQPLYYSQCTRCGTEYATDDQMRLNKITGTEFKRVVESRIEEEQGKEKLVEMLIEYYKSIGGREVETSTNIQDS